MFQEKVQEWIDEVVSQSSTRLDVREHNLVESFAIWLDQQAAEQGVEPTHKSVAAGADFGYMLSQQIREK